MSTRTKQNLASLTPNLIVDAIEPCLSFWVERLGFEVTAKVMEGESLGFVILKKDAIELMLQSRASVRKDVEALAQGEYRTALYLTVEDLGPIRAALEGWPRVVPERTTFYGAREIIVRDPMGNAVFFSAHTGE
ncbi:MAG: hypothetical protein U0271_24150 [Polyangiaceae bacterium]